MKRLALLLCVVLLVGTLAIPAFAAPGKQNLGKLAKVANSAVTVDGTKDAAYSDGLTFTVKGSGNLSTAISIVWGDGYLYMFADVKDDKLTDITADAKKTSPWTADSVECFIDDDNDGKNYGMQYRVDFVGYGTWKDRNANKNYYTKDVLGTAFQYAAKKNDKGYTAEMRMPLEKGKVGAEIGLNFQINAISETYYQTKDGWNTPEYGYVVLGDAKATTAAATTKAAATAAAATKTTAAKTADMSVVIAAVATAALAGVVVCKKKH